jgi:hypothetical protein
LPPRRIARRHQVRVRRRRRIPPTNNLAERDLRPNKTQQKISGRLTSEKATRNRLAIRSYISTAVKHGINAMVVHSATPTPETPGHRPPPQGLTPTQQGVNAYPVATLAGASLIGALVTVNAGPSTSAAQGTGGSAAHSE